MNCPLISVIVPIFKVEPWLERCVRSIMNQTYRNLEIILIDDESPDRCGEMCDSFAQEDDRIKVVHQTNGGLSAARNTGLEISQGEFVGFVDSDDFIHPEMYSRLYADITEHHTCLSFCQPLMWNDSSTTFPSANAKTECLNRKELISKALEDNIWYSAYTKLYHRSLFEGIRYPEGRTNEDYPVTIKIFDRCDRIAVNYNKLYAYCKREGSITTAPINESSFDCITSAEEVYLFVKESYPDFIPYAAKNLLSACIGLLLKTDGKFSHKYEAYRNEIFEVIRQYFPKHKCSHLLKSSQRFLLSAANAGNNYYACASKIYRALKSLQIKCPNLL